MIKFWNDLLFGLAFGMGFCLAYAVIKFIAGLLGHAGLPAEAGKL